MANTKLTRTAGTPTNNSKWTVSVWLKRNSLAGDDFILDGYVSANDRFKLAFQSANKLEIWNSNGGSDDAKLDSPRVFRDTNAWYHIVLSMDATLATASDRFKLYVNGTRETNFGTNINPPQNSTEFVVNQNGATITIGDYYGGSNAYDGCMSHFHFIDGTAYDASAFGSTDSTTGEWKINTSPSVTYGNNGFFIFKDNASVTDQSGNSNNFTVSSGTLTQTEDCPSNIFCTYNSLGTNRTMSNGNTVVTTTNADFYGAAGTIGASSGKYYWEVKLTTSTYSFVGVDYNPGESFRNNTSSNTAHTYLIYPGNGSIYHNSAITSYGSAYSQGDIVGIAMDLDNSKLYFRKNGDAWFNSGDPTSGSTGTGAFALTAGETYFPFVGDSTSGYGAVTSTNFGNGFFGTTAISSEGTNASNNGKFEYDVPTGYTALSTKGLNE